MNRRPLPLLICGLTVLSACGGGGGSGSGSGESFASLASQGGVLIGRYHDATATPESQMPSGTARFDGVAGYSVYGTATDALTDPDAVSTISLEADFGGGTVSGELADFHGAETGRVGGSVSISNGTISGNGLTADLNGTLSSGGLSETVSGSLEGLFVGDNAEAVAGTITTDDIDLFGDSVTGVFGAER